MRPPLGKAVMDVGGSAEGRRWQPPWAGVWDSFGRPSCCPREDPSRWEGGGRSHLLSLTSENVCRNLALPQFQLFSPFLRTGSSWRWVLGRKVRGGASAGCAPHSQRGLWWLLSRYPPWEGGLSMRGVFNLDAAVEQRGPSKWGPLSRVGVGLTYRTGTAGIHLQSGTGCAWPT